MEPVTVTFNGTDHVQSVTEIPDDTLTAGEYCAAVVAAHAVPGVDHELVMPDGEPVPDDLDVTLLSGLTVRLRAKADPAANLAHLVDGNGEQVEVPDGGDAAEPETITEPEVDGNGTTEEGT